MELAGLEPATSWVRCPLTSKVSRLQRFMGERLECRNISRNSLHRVLQRHEILDRLPAPSKRSAGEHLHGKEGIDGSSPSEGLEIAANCHVVLSTQASLTPSRSTEGSHYKSPVHPKLLVDLSFDPRDRPHLLPALASSRSSGDGSPRTRRRAAATCSAPMTAARMPTSSAATASAGSTNPTRPANRHASAPPSRFHPNDPAIRRRKAPSPRR